MLSPYLPTKTPRNAIEILNSKTRSLNSLINDEKIGETTVRALLSLLITETLEFYSITNSMSDTQIAVTINLILSNPAFTEHKPDFYIMCFDNAKMFRYGKNYNRIDGQIIFEWLNQCNEDYIMEIESHRIMEHNKINKNHVAYGDYSTIPLDPKDRPVPMPENIKELYRKIGTKLPEVKKETPIDPTQVLVNSFISDFEKLSIERGAIRFFQLNDKFLEMNSYLEMRIADHEEKLRNELIERITFENPFVFLKQRGAYESVYITKLNETTNVEFYVIHDEYKGNIADIHYATEIIDFLI